MKIVKLDKILHTELLKMLEKESLLQTRSYSIESN